MIEGTLLAGRYEVDRKVGAGGMSDVYRAKDLLLGRNVAIKVLKQEFSEDRNFVSKFRTEAQSAAGLEHPNIVNIYDVGIEEGMYYIVMEYVDGITLKTYIEKKGQLNFKESVSIAIQVARGIEAAHNKDIIHRDIKPQNIIISSEGKVKVTDFGIARAASANTISSDVMGSVHYASPEQARNGFVDERSDIYSLGIVMYEMITGRVPFDGETTVAVAIQHLQDEMVPPSRYAPDIPKSFEMIIRKCTQKSQERRYQNIGEVMADLRHSLVDPDGDFVVIPPLFDSGKTRIIGKEEVQEIRKYEAAIRAAKLARIENLEETPDSHEGAKNTAGDVLTTNSTGRNTTNKRHAIEYSEEEGYEDLSADDLGYDYGEDEDEPYDYNQDDSDYYDDYGTPDKNTAKKTTGKTEPTKSMKAVKAKKEEAPKNSAGESLTAAPFVAPAPASDQETVAKSLAGKAVEAEDRGKADTVYESNTSDQGQEYPDEEGDDEYFDGEYDDEDDEYDEYDEDEYDDEDDEYDEYEYEDDEYDEAEYDEAEYDEADDDIEYADDDIEYADDDTEYADDGTDDDTGYADVRGKTKNPVDKGDEGTENSRKADNRKSSGKENGSDEVKRTAAAEKSHTAKSRKKAKKAEKKDAYNKYADNEFTDDEAEDSYIYEDDEYEDDRYVNPKESSYEEYDLDYDEPDYDEDLEFLVGDFGNKHKKSKNTASQGKNSGKKSKNTSRSQKMESNRKKGRWDDEEDNEEDTAWVNPRLNKAVMVMGWLCAIGLVVLILYLIGGVFGLFRFTESKDGQNTEQVSVEKVEMISILGDNYQDAEKKLEKLGLSMNVKDIRESDRSEGTVIQQDYKEGEMVDSGTEIQVIIAGVNPVEVPNVIGYNETTAEQTLASANLTTQKSFEYSDTIPEGTIISQDPASGKVTQGTVVKLVISQGSETESVPNVVGKSEDYASSTLTDSGFRVNVKYSYSNTVNTGFVIKQSPESGKTIQTGKTVTITISQGPQSRAGQQENTNTENNTSEADENTTSEAAADTAESTESTESQDGGEN